MGKIEDLSVDEYEEKIKTCVECLEKDLKNVGTSDAGRHRGLQNYQEIMNSHQKWLKDVSHSTAWELSESEWEGSKSSDKDKTMFGLFKKMKEKGEDLLSKSEYASPNAYERVSNIIMRTYNDFLDLDDCVDEIIDVHGDGIDDLVKKIDNDSVELPVKFKIDKVSTVLINQADSWRKRFLKYFRKEKISETLEQKKKKKKLDEVMKSLDFPVNPMARVLPQEQWGRLLDFLNIFKSILKTYISEKVV